MPAGRSHPRLARHGAWRPVATRLLFIDHAPVWRCWPVGRCSGLVAVLGRLVAVRGRLVAVRGWEPFWPAVVRSGAPAEPGRRPAPVRRSPLTRCEVELFWHTA